MKIKLSLVLILIMPLALTNCKFFEKRTLFTKEVDTLLEIPDEPIEDTAVVVEMPEEPQPVAPMEAPEKQVMKPQMNGDKYYMIVGCFLTPQYADAYSEKIGAMGYNTQIISRPDGFNMVAAQSYNNFRDAVNDLSSFRSNVQVNSWVYVKR